MSILINQQIEQLNQLNQNDSDSFPVVIQKKGEKAEDAQFDPNTFNPFVFMLAFGIDEINVNMEAIQANAAQVQTQEIQTEAVNKELQNLQDKMQQQDAPKLSGFEKFAAGFSWFVSFGGGWKFEGLSDFEKDWGKKYGFNGTPSISQSDLALDQNKQTLLNSSATQVGNYISSDMKDIDNSTNKDMQMAQMISTMVQDEQAMMSTRVNG